MKRNMNEQNCHNEKAHDAKNRQGQDACDFIRRGQQLHDAAVYMVFSNLVELVGKVFSIGRDKDYPPVMPKKGNRRGWAA
jgi:hypothetical protein